jgi:SM-20-related protein
MINVSRIARFKLETQPYQWAMVDELFSPTDSAAVVASYPTDHFKAVTGYDGEKGYVYHARSLIHINAQEATYEHLLSPAWRQFARDLLSPEYRSALSKLIGVDLTHVPMEANVFHFGPGAWLGPHLDLKNKIVTHVFYFNEAWHPADGGCLRILRSKNEEDAASEISPIVGNSSVLVRSEQSWHSVSRVARNCDTSRRSVTVTFFHPKSVTTLWQPHDSTPLADYNEAALRS